jgi:WhiB family transcriptional regulator, redox-sensing transcriptional regulator
MIDTSWGEHAACLDPGTDPEWFFPLSESGAGARQVAAAKAVCARCPVAAQCLAWAVLTGEPAGIWGGTTPEERRLLRHSPQKTAVVGSGYGSQVIDGGAARRHGCVSAAG